MSNKRGELDKHLLRMGGSGHLGNIHEWVSFVQCVRSMEAALQNRDCEIERLREYAKKGPYNESAARELQDLKAQLAKRDGQTNMLLMSFAKEDEVALRYEDYLGCWTACCRGSKKWFTGPTPVQALEALKEGRIKAQLAQPEPVGFVQVPMDLIQTLEIEVLNPFYLRDVETTAARKIVALMEGREDEL